MSNHLRRSFESRNGGFTLVELMVAMLLGLVIIGGATGVILANRQSYRTNEGLSQLQESARSAFELMARDIRQAGVTGCDSNGRIANVLETDGTEWWKTWFAMRGFGGDADDGAVDFGTDRGQRLAGTDSLQLQGLDGGGFAVKTHSAVNATFVLNTETTNIASGDVMMVCDFDHAAIFAVNGYNTETDTLDYSYSATETGAIRNCSEGLGFPTNCGSETGNAYPYLPSAQLSRVMAVNWFVGNNGRNDGTSLFRQRMGVDDPEEMVAGVSGLSLRYLEEGEGGFEASPGNWANVVAVEVTLTIDSADQRISTEPGENQGRLRREFTNVITLRNRVL